MNPIAVIMTADSQVSINVTHQKRHNKGVALTEVFLVQAVKMLEASLMHKMQGSFGVSHISMCQ